MPDENKEVDFLDLPDDELPDYPPGDEPETTPEDKANTDTEEEENDDVDAEESDDGENDGESSDESEENEDTEGSERGDASPDDDETSDDSSGDGEGDEESEEEGTSEENNKEGRDEGLEKPDTKSSKGDTKKEATATESDQSSVTPETQLKKLFAPFRANGRNMQVSSVEDAITLMSMGANYNKKMEGMKPNQRIIKMLGNNKLLDEEKLSYLIDLDKKDPKAIAKLIKDSGFDPDEQDEDTDYTPNSYTVDDKEVDLDMVLDEIKDTPTFQKTVDTISNKWDSASKLAVQKEPRVLRTINAHMENGMYEQIMDVVQNEKALNRLTDLSDLQAYKYVGDTLQKAGAFDKEQPPKVFEKKPEVKKIADPKLKKRKKAAANTRSKGKANKSLTHLLDLPDDEFEKQSANMSF